MVKEVLTAKVGPRTLDRLESYADREGISTSEAADRMVKQGLDVQESDMPLVPVRSDGGTEIEDELNNLQSDVRQASRLTSLLLGSIIYLAIEVSIGFPGWFILTTGPIIIIGLIYELLKGWGYV